MGKACRHVSTGQTQQTLTADGLPHMPLRWTQILRVWPQGQLPEISGPPPPGHGAHLKPCSLLSLGRLGGPATLPLPALLAGNGGCWLRQPGGNITKGGARS